MSQALDELPRKLNDINMQEKKKQETQPLINSVFFPRIQKIRLHQLELKHVMKDGSVNDVKKLNKLLTSWNKKLQCVSPKSV